MEIFMQNRHFEVFVIFKNEILKNRKVIDINFNKNLTKLTFKTLNYSKKMASSLAQIN